MRSIPTLVYFLVVFAVKRLVCCVVLIMASHYCSHRWGREENRKREGKEKEPTKAQTCQASCWLQSCSCWMVAKKRWVTKDLFIAILLLLTFEILPPPSPSLSLRKLLQKFQAGVCVFGTGGWGDQSLWRRAQSKVSILPAFHVCELGIRNGLYFSLACLGV